MLYPAELQGLEVFRCALKRFPIAAGNYDNCHNTRKAFLSTRNKPTKPYPEFPPFAHPNGQWAKKIQGKTDDSGMWEDTETALHVFLDRI